METNAAYEELKQTTKSVWEMITSNELFYALILFVVLVILLKIVDIMSRRMKKRGSMLAGFIAGCVKVFLLAAFGMRISSLLPGLKDLTSQIVLSSSLIVVVLGFVFQEGLSNIVHGFIISIFKPFAIGDRISVVVDGETITGYVKEITPRHTVIQNVINSSHTIVPNAKMDTSLITNSYFDRTTVSTAFLDIEITYESNMERAMEVIKKAVEEHPLVKAIREEKNITDPVNVLVRELSGSGIRLRTVVTTATIEENFAACSDIRRQLVHIFGQEKDLHFAYPHVQVVSGETAEKAGRPTEFMVSGETAELTVK